MLGLKILSELRGVDDWDAVKKRTEELTPVAETHRLDYFDGYPIAEIRRYFPHLEHARPPVDYHDLYQPLQDSLEPYRLNNPRGEFQPSVLFEAVVMVVAQSKAELFVVGIDPRADGRRDS